VHLARCLALQGAPSAFALTRSTPTPCCRGSKIWQGEWRAQRAASNKVAESDLDEMYRQRSLLKRPVYPEDIAEAVYYFASDLPVKSTGNILNVDAGKRLASRGSRTLEGARRSFRPRRAGAQRAFRQGPQLYPSNMFDSSFVHNREEAAGRRTMVKIL
jgi:NAD(P)-dependent dehydrogenase (short-subunit alcohol dehydrogenase family)